MDRRRAAVRAERPLADEVEEALAWLRRRGSRSGREGLARYAIPSERAFGVPMRQVQTLARMLGRRHELAQALWETGWYEARLLAAYVDEPARVTSPQMDRWARAFDNWALCDTVCFALFDRSPHAWRKVVAWSDHRGEYVRRAALALLWGLSVHDRETEDEAFISSLPLVERAAEDGRHYVVKAANMALRAVGKRSAGLNRAAVVVARRLARSPDTGARWVGTDALRELTSPSVGRRLAARASTRRRPRAAAAAS